MNEEESYTTPEIESIEILGHTIPVSIDDDRCIRYGANGLYNGSIVLRSSYENREEYLDVIYHESFHALSDKLGLQLDLQLEEILATQCATLYRKLSQSANL